MLFAIKVAVRLGGRISPHRRAEWILREIGTQGSGILRPSHRMDDGSEEGQIDRRGPAEVVALTLENPVDGRQVVTGHRRIEVVL